MVSVVPAGNLLHYYVEKMKVHSFYTSEYILYFLYQSIP